MKKVNFILLVTLTVFSQVQAQSADSLITVPSTSTSTSTSPTPEVEVERMITDRPTQTVSSTILSKGTFQTETGVSLAFRPSGARSSTQLLAPTSLFRLGVSEYIEVRLLGEIASNKLPTDENRTSGISDLQVGAKIKILNEDDVNAKIAFLGHIIAPTGSRGISIDEFGAVNSITVSHEITKSIILGYALGYNYFTSKNGDFTYSGYVSAEVNDKVIIYAESYGAYVRLLTLEANFNVGFTYLIKPNLQLDFSYGSGLNYKMNYAAIGFSWRTSK
jgi:hypothetical protein